MEYINDISINEAVIHVLDNNSEEPIFSERPMVLNDIQYEFLYKAICKVLKNENLKYGKYEHCTKINSIQELAYEYFNSKNTLVDISKELAGKLFNIMKINGNIPSCDFLTASINTEYGPMVGILKLDYKTDYIHSIDNEINIVPLKLPKKIEKAAFLTSRDIELLVLDKRGITKEDEYGEDYFLRYLECFLEENDRDMTRKFVRAVEKFTIENICNTSFAENVRSRVKNELKNNDAVEIEKISSEIFQGNDEAKIAFDEFLRDNLETEKIEVDHEWINKKLNKLKIKTNTGIELSLSFDDYKDKEKFEIMKNSNGTIDMVIKNIGRYVEK